MLHDNDGFRPASLPLSSPSGAEFPPSETFRFAMGLSVETAIATFVYLCGRGCCCPPNDLRSLLKGDIFDEQLRGGRGTCVCKSAP